MPSVFTVDGVSYNVFMPDGGLQRSAAVLDGDNAARSRAGRMVRDIIGTYYNYTMQIDTKGLDTAAYDRLFEVLSAPVNSHQIVVPYGQGTMTFEAYVSNVDDTLKHMDDGGNRWGEMTLKFTAMEPQRRPA